MFCPDCGRECKEANFCPDCGRQLYSQIQNYQKNELGQPKMPACLYYYDMLSKLPLTEIKLCHGYLELGADGLRLVTRLPKMPKKETIIPYEELFAVTYYPPSRWVRGYLCIRDWRNRHIPLPKGFWDKSLGDNIIFFEMRDVEKVYPIYLFLQQCCTVNVEKKKKDKSRQPDTLSKLSAF